MTSKQESFVDAYILNNGNAAAACRSAGYSANCSNVTGAKLLSRSEIRNAIDNRLDELKSERTADAREILETLTAIMRGEVVDEVVTNSGKIVRVKVNCASRLKAADTLCKIYGLFRRVDDEPKDDITKLYVDTLTAIWEKESDENKKTQGN